MKKANNRVSWIDNIRALMAVFIIYFHYPCTPDSFVNFVYPFTLSVFFSISGYFFKLTGNGFIDFVCKKVKNYFPIIALNAMISCILDGITGESLIMAFKKILLQVYGCESLWFIACTLVMQILMFIVVRICCGDPNKSLVLCVVLSIIGVCWTKYCGIRLPWSLDIAFMQMLFMGIGYWYRANESRVDKIAHNWFPVNIILYISLFIAFPYNDIHQRVFSCIWFYHIHAIVGILIITAIFKKYIYFYIPCISYIGKNSLYVYAFHGYGLMLYNRVVRYIFGVNTNDESALLSTGAVVFSLVLVCLGCKAWLKIKTLYNKRHCYCRK